MIFNDHDENKLVHNKILIYLFTLKISL